MWHFNLRKPQGMDLRQKVSINADTQKIDGFSKEKSIYKLMRTGGTPILGNRQMGWLRFFIFKRLGLSKTGLDLSVRVFFLG